MSKNINNQNATSIDVLFLTVNYSFAINDLSAADIILLPKYSLLEKLTSASINKSARNLSTFIQPGIFSIITDKPTHQHCMGLIRLKVSSIVFACIDARNGDAGAAL